jgi:hypothetical protein
MVRSTSPASSKRRSVRVSTLGLTPCRRHRGFDHLYAADLTGAAAVEVGGGHVDATIWTPDKPEHVVRKH